MHWTSPFMVVGLILGLALGIYLIFSGSQENKNVNGKKSTASALTAVGVIFLVFGIVCGISLFLNIRSNKVAPMYYF